jgi:hypothetical protein
MLEVKRMRMKRSGRASIVVVITVALVAAVLGLFLLAGESPSGVAGKFLGALARGDTKTLTDLSYMEGLSPAEIEQRWKDTHENSKYWIFAYSIKDTKQQNPTNTTVVLDWVKNAVSPSSYGEKFELPMVKVDGRWKVDVRGISREMYPSLPR